MLPVMLQKVRVVTMGELQPTGEGSGDVNGVHRLRGKLDPEFSRFFTYRPIRRTHTDPFVLEKIVDRPQIA